MDEDWRLKGQEDYLYGVALHRELFRPFSPKWDHEHCEFCNSTFSQAPEDLHEGFTTLDKEYWICDTCFSDFQSQFAMQIFTPELFVGKTFLEIVGQQIICGQHTKGLYAAHRILNLCTQLEAARGIKVINFKIVPVLVAMTFHPHPPFPLPKLTHRFIFNKKHTQNWASSCGAIKLHVLQLLNEPHLLASLNDIAGKWKTKDVAIFISLQEDKGQDKGTVNVYPLQQDKGTVLLSGLNPLHRKQSPR